MKTKTAPRRFSSALENIKTAFLLGLLITLILLVIVYIGGMRAYEEALAKNDPGESFDRLWSVVSDSEPKGLDSSRLTPELIGYKQSSSATGYATLATHDGLSEMYALVKPCLIELFGSSSVCTELTASDGKHKLAAAKSNEEFVYLRYHTPVLYQLIYAYAADALTVSEGDVATGEKGNVGAYISEIVIVPDTDFAAHRFVAYATDSSGHYYEFRPGEHVVTSDFYISKLAGTAMNIAPFPFEFCDDPRFEYGEPMVKGEVEYTRITKAPVDLTGEQLHDALLGLFEYNTEKLDSYADDTGHVYVDTHSQLRIETDAIVFQTTDAAGTDSSLRGIRVDSLLGYISSDTSGLFDKLTAVDNLISRLGEISPLLIGGEGNLCLGDVYTSDSLLVIEYFLTYNGIRIGGEPYLKAVLTEQTVCELELRPYHIVPEEATELSPSPIYIFKSLDSVEKLPINAKIASVRLLYADVGAKWTVILEK